MAKSVLTYSTNVLHGPTGLTGKISWIWTERARRQYVLHVHLNAGELFVRVARPVILILRRRCRPHPVELQSHLAPEQRPSKQAPLPGNESRGPPSWALH